MTVIPIYNYIVVPNTRVFLQVEHFQQLSGSFPQVDEKVIFLILKQNEAWQDFTEDSFYPIGVSGVVREVNNNGSVYVETKDRVNVESAYIKGQYNIELNISKRPEVADLDPDDEKKRLEALKRALMEFVSEYQWGVMAKNYIAHMQTIAELVAAMSIWLQNSGEEKYSILAEDSMKKRTEIIEKLIYEFVEISKLTNEAQSEQEKDNQQLYRKAAIQKQMQFLQKELDEMNPENVSDIRRLELKIESSGMNETARREADKVLSRLKQEGKNSPESGMLYDYLDFLTSLSWQKAKAAKIDLTAAEEVLAKDHFGLAKVKKRVIQQIAVMNLKQQQSGSILLFVGAPGTGKTSIGKSIAEALKREYVRVSLGGVRDEADIRGHRRTYIGAMPGRIMDGIQKSGVSNPVVVLDEVDKLAASYNGDPASALLEVLDPEQNHTFTDHYMNVPYDLSDVLFVCTANTLATIPEPLLNRMEVIQFSGYTETDKFQIARRHLLPKSMKAAGINAGQLEVTDPALRSIIVNYTSEAGVRGLKKRLDQLCRLAAVEIVRDNREQFVVTPEQLREYLDMRPVSHEHILAQKKAGIVTGLAWTQNGGEILFIETMLTKGSGKMIITGQLGEVMKESAQIAVSLVKSLFPEQSDAFRENDLHIHVPAGAVPKDGPSAGITLTTALASLVTGRAVSPEFAMTGEVSLRGIVTPIGGLPEKLMAALRAGVKKVFIPEENTDDLKEVPEEVREQLTIIPVQEVTEVLAETGIISKEEEPEQEIA